MAELKRYFAETVNESQDGIFFLCRDVEPLLERLAVAERKAEAFDWLASNCWASLSPDGKIVWDQRDGLVVAGKSTNALEAVEDARRRQGETNGED